MLITQTCMRPLTVILRQKYLPGELFKKPTNILHNFVNNLPVISCNCSAALIYIHCCYFVTYTHANNQPPLSCWRIPVCSESCSTTSNESVTNVRVLLKLFLGKPGGHIVLVLFTLNNLAILVYVYFSQVYI